MWLPASCGRVTAGWCRLVAFSMSAWCAAFAAGPTAAIEAGTPASPFAGEGFAAWRTLSGGPVTTGWECADGVIHLLAAAKADGSGPRANATIVTAGEFGDFSLAFEWRIAPGGNSGLKYRVRQFGALHLGCEYQILDDTAAKVEPRQRSASLYGLYEPSADARPRPAGEWNSARILVKGHRIEHWLNGRRVVVATVGDADWQRRVAESKFDEYKGFGTNAHGRLMLTDHGSEVWFRGFVFEHEAAGTVPAAPR